MSKKENKPTKKGLDRYYNHDDHAFTPERGEHADEFQVEMRVMEVMNMRVEGTPAYKVIKTLMDKYGIGIKQAQNYNQKALKLLKESYDKDYIIDVINHQFAQIDNLYEYNKELGDLKECRALIETRIKLLQLISRSETAENNPTVIINLGNGINPNAPTDIEHTIDITPEDQ